MVLLHDGTFGTTAENCWSRVIEHLADDFYIFAPELLGWGGTDKVVYFDRSPYAARIPHIAAFVEAKGIPEAFFAGVSFGGSLLVRAMLETGNPWRVKRAVSISGSGGPYRLATGNQALAEYVPSLKAAEDLTKLLVTDVSELGHHVQDRYQNSLVPGHWEALAAPRLRNPSLDKPPPQDNYVEQLATLNIPLLLVAGARDQLLESRWAEKLAAISPMISTTELQSGHEPNISDPGIVGELLKNYFLGASR